MFTIYVPPSESYNEATQEFVYGETATFEIEHSLAALSKWEEKWCKPFLDSEKTDEQTVDYIRCMTVTPNVPPEVYDRITNETIDRISEYMSRKATATWFSDKAGRTGKKEVITAEIIYHWMIAHSIPFECQHWHLNRLLTLIRVCNQKSNPEGQKKMSQRELMERNRRLNAERRAKNQGRG